MNNNIFDQIRLLHDNSNYDFCIATKENQQFHEKYFNPQSSTYLEEVSEYIEMNKLNKDLWISISGFNGKRDTQNLGSCYVFICEYDCGEKGHNNTNQPFETVEEAINTITGNFSNANLLPTMVINSGHGIHCYWRIEENLVDKYSPDEFKKINETLFQIGLPIQKKNMFKNETKDYARILRIVDTYNFKNINNKVPVTLIQYNESKAYKCIDIEQITSEISLVPESLCSQIKIIDDEHFLSKVQRYLPDKFIEFIKNDIYKDPFNQNHTFYKEDSSGNIKVDRSAKDFFIYRNLKYRAFTDDEIYAIFDKYSSTNSKFSTYPDKKAYIQSMSNNYTGNIDPDYKLQRDFPFIEKRKNNLLLNKNVLYNWFAENINTFTDFFLRNGDTVYNWNDKYWTIFTSDQIKAFLRKYFSSKGIHILEKFHYEELYLSLYNSINEEKSFGRDYTQKISIAFSNGTLYINPLTRTHHFESNIWDKNDYNLFMIDYNYEDYMLSDAKYANNIIGQYLQEYYTSQEIEVMQSFFASILIPDFNLQKALFILGSGGDGKSVLVETLCSLFNNSASSTLNVSKWDKAHENIALANSIINISNEITSREIGTDTFKSIIAQDTITFNPKFEKTFKVKPFCKHIFIANVLPNMSLGPAEMRRMIFTKTAKSVLEENRSDTFRISFEKNKGSLLNFMLLGIFKLIDNNFKLNYHNKTLESELISMNEPLEDFICEYFIYDTNEFIEKKHLLELYQYWSSNEGQGLMKMGKTKFYSRLKKLFELLKWKVDLDGQKKLNGLNTRVALGIKFNENGNKILQEINKSKSSWGI